MTTATSAAATRSTQRRPWIMTVRRSLVRMTREPYGGDQRPASGLRGSLDLYGTPLRPRRHCDPARWRVLSHLPQAARRGQDRPLARDDIRGAPCRGASYYSLSDTPVVKTLRKLGLGGIDTDEG